jgi:hypothetical protein
MATYKIICIHKPDVNSTHEHITHIGYLDANGNRTIITVEDAIRRIDINSKEFYVDSPFGTAYVEVARHLGHRPYIKTYPDRTQKDNLLSLPQC